MAWKPSLADWTTILPSPDPISRRRAGAGGDLTRPCRAERTLLSWLGVAGTNGRQTLLRAGKTNGTETVVMASPAPPTRLAMIRPARLGGRPPGFLANSACNSEHSRHSVPALSVSTLILVIMSGLMMFPSDLTWSTSSRHSIIYLYVPPLASQLSASQQSCQCTLDWTGLDCTLLVLDEPNALQSKYRKRILLKVYYYYYYYYICESIKYKRLSLSCRTKRNLIIVP